MLLYKQPQIWLWECRHMAYLKTQWATERVKLKSDFHRQIDSLGFTEKYIHQKNMIFNFMGSFFYFISLYNCFFGDCATLPDIVSLKHHKQVHVKAWKGGMIKGQRKNKQYIETPHNKQTVQEVFATARATESFISPYTEGMQRITRVKVSSEGVATEFTEFCRTSEWDIQVS